MTKTRPYWAFYTTSNPLFKTASFNSSSVSICRFVGFKPFLVKLCPGDGAAQGALVLLQCPLLPGYSRVDGRINCRFNGSMTKNVKDGLGAGNARPASARLLLTWDANGGGNQAVSNKMDL